jgi:serine/threonine protein kinase
MHKQAVKLMHANIELDEDLAARARDEARLMSQLHHDHVVAVYALTKLEDRWAVFMEYVQGIDAGALLASSQGGLPPKVAVAMIERACAALDAAWNQPSPDTGRPLRVVHRDLKPANLMLSVEGSLKVMDFGVARADFDREAQTQSTQYGTGRYMAPERWLHIRAEHASDVYALGVTLYEMLSGLRFERMPLAPANFESKLEEMLGAIPHAQDPKGDVTQILRKMLTFNDDGRLSAAQAMDALDDVAEGLSGPSLRRYARSVVPPLLKERQRELLNDSVVWPGGSPITPTPGAAPSSASTANSGPTAETRAEPSSPIQLAATPVQKTSSPASFQGSQELQPEKSLLLPATGGIGLGLALVAAALFWVAGGEPELEPTVNGAKTTVTQVAASQVVVSELSAEVHVAPEQLDVTEWVEREPVASKPPSGRRGKTPPAAETQPETQPEKIPETVIIPKERPQVATPKETFSIMFTADPMTGSVSYKGQSAVPLGTLQLEEGTHTLSWRWDDGETLSCSVRATAGKRVKFDRVSEKCK